LRFQQFSALQKHIQSSESLKQVPKSYLIVHPQREERRRLLEELGKELTSVSKNAATAFFEGEETSWGQVIDTLMSPSLFGDEQIVVWNGLKNLPEQVLEKSRDYILNPTPGTFFVMGAESAKGFSDLYQNTKKELILLDFSEEKPWDKQKRIQQEMFLLIKKEGKRISPDAWNKLTFLTGLEPLILESELMKVITYIGERKDILERDVEAIASSSSTATGWQLADGLVWTENLSIPSASIDPAFLLGLLGQVRFYIQQGRQVGLCLQQKMTPEEIGKQMPQLKPAQFQKVASNLRLRKMAYFDEALSTLYEVELLSKNSNFSPAFLFDLLAAKLAHLKKTCT